MEAILFPLLVIILAVIFVGSGFLAHAGGKVRTIAGWWSGIVLSVILLFTSSSYFQEIPIGTRMVLREHYRETGCGREYFNKEVPEDYFDFETLGSVDISISGRRETQLLSDSRLKTETAFPNCSNACRD